MVVRMAAVVGALGLAACSDGEGGDKGPGGGGGDSGSPDTTCPSTFTGPVLLADLAVTCDADGAIDFYAETAGWAGGGKVFAIDSASAVPWTEEHDLESAERDPCGAWDHLHRVVPARASTASTTTALYERNVSSFFTCDAHIDAGVMTYAFAVLDDAGAVIDCVIAGADPQGLADGTYAPAFVEEPSFDLTACDLGAL